MGNRAVITSYPFRNSNVGIYVHWNGGQESIVGFLNACRELGYRDPLTDSYGWARLASVIAHFFGRDGLSVGVDVIKNLDTDNGDNGTWLLGPDWTIKGRKYGGKLSSLTKEQQARADAICFQIVSALKDPNA